MASQPRVVIVIFAHPDDAEFICGGTVAKLTKQGDRVHYLATTDGNRGVHDLKVHPSELVEVRRQEQREAAEVLGVRSIEFLGYEDGDLKNIPDLAADYMLYIRRLKPDILLSFDPWRPYEMHPDHRAVGYAACEAGYLSDAPWYHPEHSLLGASAGKPREIFLFAPAQANYYVDISTTIEAKIKAILCHRSQVAEPGFSRPDVLNTLPRWIRARAEEVGKEAGSHGSAPLPMAEAFHKVGRSDVEL
jgi:LmbE family N-acetylglucosaminyl deacetylase